MGNFLLKNLNAQTNLTQIDIALSISMHNVICIGVVPSVDIRGLVMAVVAITFF